MSSAVVPGTDRPQRQRSRSRQTAWDMVRTMAVIGACVLVVYLLVPRPSKVEQPPPDVRAAVMTAADGMGVPGRPARLAVPQVPTDWHANAATWNEVAGTQAPTLHIGYLTGDEQYVAADITQRGTPQWINEITHNGTVTGTTAAAGRTWQVYRSEDRKRHSWLLVRPAAELRASTTEQGNKVTTVINGTGSEGQLRTLAEAVVSPHS